LQQQELSRASCPRPRHWRRVARGSRVTLSFVVASPDTLVPSVSYVPSLARINVLFLEGPTRWAAQPPIEDENNRQLPTANRQTLACGLHAEQHSAWLSARPWSASRETQLWWGEAPERLKGFISAAEVYWTITFVRPMGPPTCPT
jgi:hypothetical protein